jgi:hypothetical protein
MAGGFLVNTRRKIVNLNVHTASAAGGNTTFYDVPKVGFLAAIYSANRGTIASGAGAVPATGKAAILRDIRLMANAGLDVFGMSGAHYHYLLRELFDSEYIDILADTDARSAAANAAFNVDTVIPVALNLRDAIGLLMLQSEALTLTFQLTWETALNIMGASATYSVVPTATPFAEIFTIPNDPRDWPRIDVVNQHLADTQAVPAAGQWEYQWPKGNVYLHVVHGLGIGAAGADGFSAARLRVQQSDSIQNTNLLFLTRENYRRTGRARVAGTVTFDLLGTSGLGSYGLTRDLLDSGLLTDLATELTATGAGTAYNLRHQLVNLNR